VGIVLARLGRLCVTVANGDKLLSPGCCRNMEIAVHGEPFRIDSYSLPLGSYDMVLGVQWLRVSLHLNTSY
jgi:hypothetical protein